MNKNYRFLIDYDIFTAKHLAELQGWKRIAELSYIDHEGIEVTIISSEGHLVGTRGVEVYQGRGFTDRKDWFSFQHMLIERGCTYLNLVKAA